jgi:hypothetical protein
MKIKNIQQYRNFYKEKIRQLPTRDENFIGNYLFDENEDKKFGWFEIYHGDKEGYGKAENGIENFLQSFLDMAKDGQAVYEFLQNAVDAGSTHYTMIWEQDAIDGNYYLLVANNGEMFDLNSIRSILNVGSSTKTADSQTIGKFGIGFKLAHRLVGKDNGLNELINENSGPILFSWKNYELANLAQNETLQPTEISYNKVSKDNYTISDVNPWLFKILITCFPCLPENEFIEEQPKLSNGIRSPHNPFSKEEYGVLCRWVAKHQAILNKDTYNEGSLFFIKLGSGKESELSELNLKEGVKFALAILKETADTEEKKEQVLHTVQLNNEEPITYPDLEYINIVISKDTEPDLYANVRFGVDNIEELTKEQFGKLNQEANIEVLFGFRKHHQIGEYFKGAPNLYLYFPLSEEVHNFNYVLHSNAFYKGSSRTFLHKGSHKEDGINERLLKAIVIKIEENLKKLSSSENQEDRAKFLDFYAALLTSRKSLNQDRLWIEKPYINPIDEILKRYIPVKVNTVDSDFVVVDDADCVYIKKTDIDILTKDWEVPDVYWFFWNNNELILEAALEKLEIEEFTIKSLFSVHVGIHKFINTWINKEKKNNQKVIMELSRVEASESMHNAIFKETFFNVEIVEFPNNEFISFSKFQEVEKDGYFLKYNKLVDVAAIFSKLELKTSVDNFDEFSKFFPFFGNESQVRSHLILTKLFSSTVLNERLLDLSFDKKHKVFDAFRTLNDTPGDRLGELKLFCNNTNTPVCFKNLFLESDKNWFNKFCIKSNENHSSFKAYFVSGDEKVYEHIIFPFWKQILLFISKETNASIICDDIKIYFHESTWNAKNRNLLEAHNLVLYKGEVVETNSIYFNNKLETLSDAEYAEIQELVLSRFEMHVPDKVLLKILAVEPFEYISENIDIELNPGTYDKSELFQIIKFAKICEFDFFESNCLVEKENVFSIVSSTESLQYFSDKPLINSYLEQYYQLKLRLLPDTFHGVSRHLKLVGGELVKYLVENFEEESIDQELRLIEIVLLEGHEICKLFFEKITDIHLNSNWPENNQNELYLKLINKLAEIEGISIEDIQNKILIIKDAIQIRLVDIESANDTITINHNNKEIRLSQTKLLNLPDAKNVLLVQKFYEEVRHRDLVSEVNAITLFKIIQSDVTEDLVIKFSNCLERKQLANAHQVAFVLFSGKYEAEDIYKFSVQFHNDNWFNLKGTLVLYSERNEKFIKPSVLLNQAYKQLQILLNFSDFEAISYTDDEDDVMVPRFQFIRGCNPEILGGNEELNLKLDYLHNGYLNIKREVRVSKKNKEWNPFLGFNLNEFVSSGLFIENEKLPDSITKWINNEWGKERFLAALGLNVGEKSHLNILRKYLLEEGKSLNLEATEISKYSSKVLLNTLKGLANGFEDFEPKIYFVEKDKERIALVQEIIIHLYNKEINETPLFAYAEFDKLELIDSEEYDIYFLEKSLWEGLNNYPGNHLSYLIDEFNMLYQFDGLPEAAVEKCTLLQTEIQPIIANLLEHDEPFYRKWKEINRISLFKKIDPAVDVYCVEDILEPFWIGKTRLDETFISQKGELIELYYDKEHTLEALTAKVTENYPAIGKQLAELIFKKDTLLKNFYSTLNAADKDEINDEHLNLIKEALNEESLKQERKELIDKIKEKEDYAYSWFKTYLEFLLTFENSESTTSQKSITFQKIERHIIDDVPSNRFFILKGANSAIPYNIEDFEDFKISLIFKNRQNVNLKVEGVSRKGQDLMVYCRESVPSNTLTTLSLVIQAKISFSPVTDLLEKLYRAFINRENFDEWTNIRSVLPSLQFIYGPPGTGKTTTLCKIVEEEVQKNHNTKFLILTPTNKAADVLCRKLIERKDTENNGLGLAMGRLSKPTDPELENLDDHLYLDSVNSTDLENINLLASTIHRLPYFDVINDSTGKNTTLFKIEGQWDFIVFDEASMINLPYLVFSILALAKSNPEAKIIIAGDPKQIPPVINVNDTELEKLDIQDENVYTMMGINSFRKSEQVQRPIDKILNLEKQFRSVPEIGQLFSEFSYSNLLSHYRGEISNIARPLPKEFKPFVSGNVTFIDIPLNVENSIFEVKKLLYSPYHIYTAILVAEIIKYFDTTIKDNDSWTIGLISPYKAQAILMNKLITSFGLSSNVKIYADTVHGFQGDECDMVFFIANPNGFRYSGHKKALLSKEYIYNVAISRARDYLFILHPYNVIQDNPYINALSNIHERNFGRGTIRNCAEYEKMLFGEINHIEKSSYLTGHDTINVFGQIDMKYFIKANNNAIDIQLRKLE